MNIATGTMTSLRLSDPSIEELADRLEKDHAVTRIAEKMTRYPVFYHNNGNQ
ncbi:hypothetical protein PanWU01x14_158720, partial [Parasponia andersonii]